MMMNPCVTDKNNPQLDTRQKAFLKFHYKLGHLGFQHLRWLIRKFNVFGSKGLMAISKECDDPLCSSCVTGGIQRLPMAPGMDKYAQKVAKRGILKRDQL